MESDKEVNGVHKLSNSNTQHEATNQKQVSIENSALPSIQPAYHLSTTNFEFMAKDISQLDDEERLEQKLAFYFQPYSSNGYDFKEFMKFDADENCNIQFIKISKICFLIISTFLRSLITITVVNSINKI